MFQWSARFLTAGALYVMARWIFGIGSPVTDWRTVARYLRSLADRWPDVVRYFHRTWLVLREVVGLTEYQLRSLRTRIEQGSYADDCC